eukprot:2495539-Prymnesium_polylepis.1
MLSLFTVGAAAYAFNAPVTVVQQRAAVSPSFRVAEAPQMGATIRELRDRVSSVKNTKKITSAMKLVAAAKVRRAQEAVLRSRPFSETLERILGGLLQRLKTEALDIPLLEQRTANKVCIISITGDRGLCGGYNSAAIKKTEARIAELKEQASPPAAPAPRRRAPAHVSRRQQANVRWPWRPRDAAGTARRRPGRAAEDWTKGLGGSQGTGRAPAGGLTAGGKGQKGGGWRRGEAPKEEAGRCWGEAGRSARPCRLTLTLAVRSLPLVPSAQGVACELVTIGNKGTTYFKKRETPVRFAQPCTQAPSAAQATEIANEMLSSFYAGEFDRVELIYTTFVSMIS